MAGKVNKAGNVQTCGIARCVAGCGMGLVGSSRVGLGGRSVGALGTTILRAVLVLRGILGPCNSSGCIRRRSLGNTQQGLIH